MSQFMKQESVDLKFTDISYSIPNGRKKDDKRILKGVSGKFLSGQLSAILGPSGAGKTTLLNILSGFRLSGMSGEILVNGKPRCLKSFRKQSCYIMQDDALLLYLTVQESMQVAASLKLGNNVSKFEKTSLIQEILATLNLEESQSTRVSNLSGGEMKRLSIALELINNPPVMLLDEPTSGLDSLNSYQCINLLKQLAEGGRTIVCTIHQPSARLFETFDYLFAVAEGHCIYRGKIPDLIPFMSSLSLECPAYHNPADFLIEVASGQYGKFITQLVQAIDCRVDNDLKINQEANQSTKGNLDLRGLSSKREISNGESNKGSASKNECIYVPKNETKLELTECENKFLRRNDDFVQYPVPFWYQFCVLLIRTFGSIYRNPMLTLLQFAAHLVVGISVGVLFYNTGNEASQFQSNVGYLVVCLLFLIFTSMMMTILTFPLEMKVFIREYLNNWYSLKAYYFAKTVADIPFQLVFTVLFASIVYFMTNQPHELSRFLLITSILILATLVAQSIGLTIGAAMDAQKAVYYGTAALIPPFLFAGYFATFSTIPVYIRWLTYISFIKYAYEGSVRATYLVGRGELHCSEPFCMFKYPKKIMKQLQIEENGVWMDILVLCIFFIIIRILGYFIFRWKLRMEQGNNGFRNS